MDVKEQEIGGHGERNRDKGAWGKRGGDERREAPFKSLRSVGEQSSSELLILDNVLPSGVISLEELQRSLVVEADSHLGDDMFPLVKGNVAEAVRVPKHKLTNDAAVEVHSLASEAHLFLEDL